MPQEEERAQTPVDPTPVATQPQESRQSPSEPQAGHDTTPNAGASVQPTQDTPQAEQIDPEEYTRLKREHGKLPQTQEELKKVKQTKENFEKWILGSPERTKQALIEIDGWSEAEAAAEVERVRQARPDLWQGTPQSAPSIDINQVVSRVRAQETFERDLEEFKTLVPELAPGTGDADEESRKRDLASEVDTVAASFMKRNPKMKRVDAWVKAYKTLTDDTEEEVSSARAEGVREGMYRARVDDASSMSEPQGSTPGRSSSVKLTDAERQAAELMDMTPEEYAKNRV